jgi:hypothetical protein
MKNIKNIVRIAALAVAGVFVSACDLDINVDPNNPSVVPPSQLLPTAMVRIANSVGTGSIGLSNGASVWMHQNVQRTGYDQYAVTGTDYAINQAWDESYTALKDLKTIIETPAASINPRYVGIAKLMKAYIYSEMVDAWGDIPYTEANQGAGVPNPKFDDDKAIYESLLKLIDEGIADVVKTDAVNVFIPASDLIYAGNATRWAKFGRTLKLKLLTNTRLVNSIGAEATALLAASADLIGAGDDFEMKYGTSSSPENRNPGYLIDYPNNRTNYVSPYFYEMMSGQNTFSHGNSLMAGLIDPRIPYYFCNQKKKGEAAENPSEYVNEVGSAGKFISIFFGSKGRNQGFDQASSQTMPGLYYAGGKFDNNSGGKVSTTSGKGNVSLRMLPYFNRLFLEAELKASGTVAGDAKPILEMAIRAAFTKLNSVAAADGSPAITTAAIDTYVKAVMDKYTTDNALELIMTQKWIANYGFALDSYTDYRRTGFPKLYDPSKDDPKTYAVSGALPDFTQLERQPAISFPWKLNEITLNKNAPAEQKIISTYKIFWMK